MVVFPLGQTAVSAFGSRHDKWGNLSCPGRKIHIHAIYRLKRVIARYGKTPRTCLADNAIFPTVKTQKKLSCNFSPSMSTFGAGLAVTAFEAEMELKS